MMGSGSNLPPGVTTRMIDEAYGAVDAPCDVCGKPVDDCVCPACPVCQSIGDPKCYDALTGHGLARSPEQIASRQAFEAGRQKEYEAHARMDAAAAREEARIEMLLTLGKLYRIACSGPGADARRQARTEIGAIAEAENLLVPELLGREGFDGDRYYATRPID